MEPTRFEKSLHGPEKVVRRHQRTRILARILEFACVTIDDVVNDPRAKLRVRGLYRAADACEWESRRTWLRARFEYDGWVRENR